MYASARLRLSRQVICLEVMLRLIKHLLKNIEGVDFNQFDEINTKYFLDLRSSSSAN